MSSTRQRDTAPEIGLRRELHARGLRFRVDRAVLPDRRRRVDIVFGPARVAALVDGCFWHGCSEHGTSPKANASFWQAKIATNQRRDRDTDLRLAAAGWKVVRVWEHEDPVLAADRIEAIVRDRRIARGLTERRSRVRASMHGPQILVESMSLPQPRGPSNVLWQYHSRSDLHSKVACWAAFFDLLRTSALLRQHASSGKVIFGINFEMRDYAADRKKDLDLVIARPSGPPPPNGPTFGDLATRWGIVLTPSQQKELTSLPTIRQGQVTGSGVLVALEAKAAMTAHGKAQSRLYDELNSSHTCIHGASSQALAVGLVMVNASATFVSPGMQRADSPAVISAHTQPAAASGVVGKVKQLPRRTGSHQQGFDGLGVLVVNAANDGTPVTLVSTPPAPATGEIFFWDDMITRVANEYDTRFAFI